MISLGVGQVGRRPRIGRPRASTGASVGDTLVDSAVRPSQLWAAVDDLPWARDIYLPILGRRTAVSFAVVHRCVSLVAGIVARLVTDTVRVVDQDGRKVTSRRAAALVATLRESIDGIAPAHATIEDVCADYALDGNSYLLPRMSGDGGVISRFERLGAPSSSAEAVLSRTGTWVFTLAPLRSLGDQVRVDEREIVHVRWPRMGGTASSRDAVAEAPIRVLRPAIAAGIEADAYILDWFRRARSGHVHVNYEMNDHRMEIDEKAQKNMRAKVEDALAGGKPILTLGGNVTSITDAPDEKLSAAARDYQLADVSRFYGLPGPMVGLNLTSWGSGIEELSRIGWRFGLSQHVARVLSPFSARCLPRGQALAVDPHWLVQGDTRAMRELILALDDPQRDPLATREELRSMAGLLTVDQSVLNSIRRGNEPPPDAGEPGPPPDAGEPGPGPGPAE